MIHTGAPGSNPPGILRDNCIYVCKISSLKNYKKVLYKGTKGMKRGYSKESLYLQPRDIPGIYGLAGEGLQSLKISTNFMQVN